MTETKPTPKPRANKQTTPPTKRLVRLPEQGKIFGVCAGLAAYTEIDVSVMRIIFVILTLASGGFGILVYLVLAVIMPTASAESVAALKSGDISDNVNHLAQEFRDSGVAETWRRYMGVALIVFGAWLLLINFFPEWIQLDWNLVWPALLVLLGIILIAKGKR